MAVAGKVAITLSTENGGVWSADITYDRLVAVKHNNNLYISRKTVANVEPPNDEFWFLALEGFGGDDVESILQAIENIINGTTQVGNAQTLDGHEAEYFAPLADLAKYLPLTGGELANSLSIKTDNSASRTRNVSFKNHDGTTFGSFGAFSENGEIKHLYIGVGNSAYHVDNNLSITRDTLKWKNKDLLHTGNKPTGTYTGNGQARTINVGGIGSVVAIHSYHTARLFSLVTRYFSICFNPATNTITYNMNSTFLDGTLTLAADDNANIAGSVPAYRVL